MIKLQQKFTRPSTSVPFFEAANRTEVGTVVTALKTAGTIVDITESTSPTGLVFTRTVFMHDEAAVSVVSANEVLTANKAARAAYNAANGITVTVTKTTV